MHLFLVSTSGAQVFAHLHPAEVDSLHFRTELPWIPAGSYLLFADIATENGLSLTASTRLEVPPATGSVTPSDADDSWDQTRQVTLARDGASRSLGASHTIVWAGGNDPIVSGQPTDLAFVVRDSANQVAQVEPYLGMPGHAVVVRLDGSVFIHLHAAGTVAPVTQHVFALRDRGDTASNGRVTVAGTEHANMSKMSGELSFPYEFPKPGRYRVWVQVKPKDRVLTGMFDVDVR